MSTEKNKQEILAFAQANGFEDIETLLRFPKYIQLETVSLCNASCRMCPIKEVKRDQDTFIMKQEIFDKIVNDVKPFASTIKRFTVQGEGEPLIDKNLEKRIKALKKAGVPFVVFGTNGSLFNEERSRSIIGSGVDEVSFSVDGATAETFEAIRTPLKYDQCVGNIQNFITLRNEINPKLNIRIRMTLQESNQHEFDAFQSFWKGKVNSNDTVYGRLLHSWGNWLGGYGLGSEQDPAVLNAKPCTAPFSTLFILSDGRAVLCCQDFNGTVTLGHMARATIQEIWHNDTINKIRDLHLAQGRKAMSICKDCNLWDPTTTKLGLQQD